MTQEQYQGVAAEEIADVLRSVAARIEENPALAISQLAEDLETAARRASDMFQGYVALGAPFEVGARAQAEIG